MRQLVIFLIRLRLGIKKGQAFRFENQKTKDIYYFTPTNLAKIEADSGLAMASRVSLNWLLDKECKIVEIKGLRA